MLRSDRQRVFRMVAKSRGGLPRARRLSARVFKPADARFSEALLSCTFGPRRQPTNRFPLHTRQPAGTRLPSWSLCLSLPNLFDLACYARGRRRLRRRSRPSPQIALVPSLLRKTDRLGLEFLCRHGSTSSSLRIQRSAASRRTSRGSPFCDFPSLGSRLRTTPARGHEEPARARTNPRWARVTTRLEPVSSIEQGRFPPSRAKPGNGSTCPESKGFQTPCHRRRPRHVRRGSRVGLGADSQRRDGQGNVTLLTAFFARARVV